MNGVRKWRFPESRYRYQSWSCAPLETESGCTRTKSRAGNVTNLLDFQDSHQNPPFCKDFAPELVPIPVQIRQST